MDLLTFIENIPPAFTGVIIGSLLTIIGVVLTNMSNTKRLKLQHEHEVKLRNKERDLNMRREVFMDAMEAISAGITAISRFSELGETPESLMQSYSKLTSKLGKVTIVGQNETIEALSKFQLEINGAFLRMSAKREKFDRLLKLSQSIEADIKSLNDTIYDLNSKVTQNQHAQGFQSEIEQVQDELSKKKSEEEVIGGQLYQTVTDLVKNSMAEVSALNKLIVPLISLMRSELELPFNKEHFAQITERGNDALEEYMSTFFDEYDEDALIED